MRGVVARVHQQTGQELADRVGAADIDADPGALAVRVLLGAYHCLIEVQVVDGFHGHQHLDDAGGAMAGVGILGGHHIPGVQIGDEP
ncbi:Uncharacterised protein [Mycobacteroides abscessus subsp. abscessus]|nr:Uncharacterised protein [Mycobacteroides abscessus subsp. abscessus]